jgi:phosphoglycolate phosphatase-like HAD superfamily hydrolase
MPHKVSEVRPFVVVELVGPLLDDRGAVVRALGQMLAGVGVDLRPGAIDQVAGAELDWALRTLLEGHGRDDLLGRIGDLHHRVITSWERLVGSEEIRVSVGAEDAWARLMVSAAPPLVLSSLPKALVSTLERRFGLLGLSDRLVSDGSGGSGLPRSAALIDALGREGISPASVLAGVASPAAILCAVGARCGEVVQVGLPTGIAEGMPVDRFAGRLDEILPQG